MHHRALTLALALFIALSAHPEPAFDIDLESIDPPPPMTYDATKTVEWPEVIPLLDDARSKNAARTVSAFKGGYSTRKTPQVACETYEQMLRDAGWSIESSDCDSDYFDVHAEKEAYDLWVTGYDGVFGGSTEVSTRLRDTSAMCTACAQEGVVDIDANLLFENVAERYANALTYSDEGRQETRYLSPSGRVTNTETLEFVTDYQRPDRFRFEYADEHRYVIFRNGEDVRSYWSLNKRLETFDDVSRPLGAATGVSGGTASMIPDLLDQSDFGCSFFGMKSPVVVGADLTDGVHCLIVESCDNNCMPRRLWIDPTTLLIHRFEETSLFDDFRTEEVTDFKPRMDHDIPEEDLAFNQSGRVETQSGGIGGGILGTFARFFASFL